MVLPGDRSGSGSGSEGLQAVRAPAQTHHDGRTKKSYRLTPMRAIRAKCLDCSGGSLTEVRECRVMYCPLRPYRSGKKPGKTLTASSGGHKSPTTPAPF